MVQINKHQLYENTKFGIKANFANIARLWKPRKSLRIVSKLVQHECFIILWKQIWQFYKDTELTKK